MIHFALEIFPIHFLSSPLLLLYFSEKKLSKKPKIPEHIMKEIQVRSGARFLLEFCGQKKISLACFSESCSIAQLFMVVKDHNVSSVTRDVGPYRWL